MKLYTEEQVRQAIMIAENQRIGFTTIMIEHLTPIELPSDEEIDTASLMISKDRKEFLMGAKYIIDKIQGDNK